MSALRYSALGVIRSKTHPMTRPTVAHHDVLDDPGTSPGEEVGPDNRDDDEGQTKQAEPKAEGTGVVSAEDDVVHVGFQTREYHHPDMPDQEEKVAAE